MKRLSVVLIGLGILAASCAGIGPPAPEGGVAGAPPPPSESAPEVPTSGSSVASEGPAADGDVAHAASELSRALEGDDRFASVEVLQGKDIVVHWDGAVDTKLRDLLDRFPGVQISVETTFCSPGKLRDYGSRLLASDPAVNLVSVAPDGSHLELMLDESVKAASDVISLERRYSEAVGCPVKVTFGDVVPAGP